MAQGSHDPPDRSNPESNWADVGIGALNGVLGDYLQSRSNDLAVEMAVHHDNKPVPIDAENLAKVYPGASRRVCVLVHGLCCTESTWTFPGTGESYGSLLQRDFEMTPVFVRYNTGLHISENGRSFCQLLDQLVASWPTEIEDLTLIGHSMGGLVIRSACLYADRLGQDWVDLVHHAVYVGSPHLGAPLEKFGNAAAAVFGKIPDPIARLARDLINRRSIGIKDLRYANLVDEDWLGRDPDAVLQNTRTEVPLRTNIQHFVVAGTLTQNENNIIAQMIGDALVRVPSAMPGGGNDIGLPDDHVKLFPGLHHMSLAHHPDVYDQLETWLRAEG